MAQDERHLLMPRHKGETVMENTIDVTMLKQQISTAASQPRQDARTAYVEFANVGLGYAVASSYNSPEYEATKATLDNLEKALAGCDDEKRIELAIISSTSGFTVPTIRFVMSLGIASRYAQTAGGCSR